MALEESPVLQELTRMCRLLLDTTPHGLDRGDKQEEAPAVINTWKTENSRIVFEASDGTTLHRRVWIEPGAARSFDESSISRYCSSTRSLSDGTGHSLTWPASMTPPNFFPENEHPRGFLPRNEGVTGTSSLRGPSSSVQHLCHHRHPVHCGGSVAKPLGSAGPMCCGPPPQTMVRERRLYILCGFANLWLCTSCSATILALKQCECSVADYWNALSLPCFAQVWIITAVLMGVYFFT